jgi:hypothetical protein
MNPTGHRLIISSVTDMFHIFYLCILAVIYHMYHYMYTCAYALLVCILKMYIKRHIAAKRDRKLFCNEMDHHHKILCIAHTRTYTHTHIQIHTSSVAVVFAQHIGEINWWILKCNSRELSNLVDECWWRKKYGKVKLENWRIFIIYRSRIPSIVTFTICDVAHRHCLL